MMVGSAYAQQSETVMPNTPEAASTIQQLKNAEYADRGNSHSWTDDNPGLDHFYATKAREADRLVKQLEGGQAVSSSDVEKALDTSHAAGYGVPPTY